VELDPQRVGNLLIPLGPRFQITKYLNFANLAQKAKKICRCFEFEALKVEFYPPMSGGPHNSTGTLISNHQTSKFSYFGSRSQIF
jgi:hypothetical protein